MSRSKAKRNQVAFVGMGVATMLGMLWIVYLHFSGKDKSLSETLPPRESVQAAPAHIPAPVEAEPEVRVETTYRVCIGQFDRRCPVGSIRLDCGSEIEKWIASKCEKLSQRLLLARGGGNACGYAVYDVKCVPSK